MLRFGMDLGTSILEIERFCRVSYHKIEKYVLNKLDIEVVDHILSSPSLKTENEDSLYDYIKSRTENDIRFSVYSNHRKIRCFSTNGYHDSWICYDFKDRCVPPTEYAIGWNSRRYIGILEASNDGASWTPCNEVNRQDGTCNLANVSIRPIPCDRD